MSTPKEKDAPEKEGAKNLAFIAITIIFSFLLALLVVEIVVRRMDFTSNMNMGSAAFDRWNAKHWRVNELGYRDLLITHRLSSQKPKIYFIGDSFAAGAGVYFKDTYYFKTGLQLQNDYNFFNIARPGLSTLGQYNEFKKFKKTVNYDPDIVVHQYFVNDIEDYISQPSWGAPAWLESISHNLESAQLLSTYFLNQEFVRSYRKLLLDAYRSPSLLEKHESDLEMLHQDIRDNGGTVIFLAFPGLSNQNMQMSSFVISEMQGFFSRTCQSNDVFIDATPAALSLKESKRIVSFLDHHPSPELHSLIANQIVKALRREGAEGGSYRAYETCESLKATQSRGAEKKP